MKRQKVLLWVTGTPFTWPMQGLVFCNAMLTMYCHFVGFVVCDVGCAVFSMEGKAQCLCIEQPLSLQVNSLYILLQSFSEARGSLLRTRSEITLRALNWRSQTAQLTCTLQLAHYHQSQILFYAVPQAAMD